MCCLSFKTYLIKRRRLCRKYWKGRRCPKIIVILSNHIFTVCRSKKESCQNDIPKFLISILASRICKRDTLLFTTNIFLITKSDLQENSKPNAFQYANHRFAQKRGGNAYISKKQEVTN